MSEYISKAEQEQADQVKDYTIRSTSRNRDYPLKYRAEVLLEAHQMTTTVMGQVTVTRTEYPVSIEYHARIGEVERRLLEIIQQRFYEHYVVYYTIKELKE